MTSFKNLLIFDLDDTLVDTSEVYWSARQRFVRVMQRQGFEPTEVVREFEEVDKSHIEIFGYVPERYERSMKATYVALERKYQRSATKDLEEEIGKCGKIIINRMPELIEGARELLAWTYKKFELALLTRGIPELQDRKLTHAKIKQYFTVIKVVPVKRAIEFQELVDELGQNVDSSWIIGDSIKSDINPGLEIGAHCILYEYSHPHYIWQQEYGEIAKGKFFRIRRLFDAKDILRKN